MNVSVVICTWNRAALLRKTLTRLCELVIPAGLTWELIVVDNNCTDDTNAVIAEFASRLPLRQLRESTPGKSHAANYAVREAKGDLILWTDDDVLADRNWLSAYVDAANRWPDAAFFGGTIEPWFERPPPTWIHKHMDVICKCFALRDFGPQIEAITNVDERMPFGANMAIRKAVQQNFQFDDRRGPSRNDEVRGEETDLIRRMSSAGYYGVWVGSARVHHFIPTTRCTERFIYDWHVGQGRMMYRLQPPDDSPSLWDAPRWAVRKFVAARLSALILRPLRNDAWLRAWLSAGTASGFIVESRYRRRLQSIPQSC